MLFSIIGWSITSTMHIAALSFTSLISLSSVAFAAPLAGGGSGDLFSQLDLSWVDEKFGTFSKRVDGIMELDRSCAAHKDLIVKGMTYAHVFAVHSSDVNEKNPEFNLFFEPKDVKNVQEMYKAISSKEYAGKEIKVSCPAPGAFEFNGSYVTTTSMYDIHLNPKLFTTDPVLATIPKTASLSVDKIKGFILSYFFLKEITGLNQYAAAAGWKDQVCDKELKAATCVGPKPRVDSKSQNPITDTIVAELAQGVCLRRQWATYKDKNAKSKPKFPSFKNRANYGSIALMKAVEKALSTQPKTQGMLRSMLAMLLLGC